MEDAGEAAITGCSLFEEQVRISALRQRRFIKQRAQSSGRGDVGASATPYDYDRGPGDYLDLVAQAERLAVWTLP